MSVDALHCYRGTITAIYKNKDNIPNGSFIYVSDTKRLYLKMDDELIGISHKIRILTNCCNCGAPLPLATSSVVQCPYCSTVQDIEEDFKGLDISAKDIKDLRDGGTTPLKSNMSLEEYERIRDINEGIMVADYNKLPPIIKNKVSEMEPAGKEEYIRIPLGDPLNFHPSPEEFEDLKAFADKNGEIKIGG